MPFWYPAKTFGEAAGAVNMCDPNKKTAIRKLIPTWDFDNCKPRQYLSSKFTPSPFAYYPDEFDTFLQKHASKTGSSKMCDFDPVDAPAALSMSLERQAAKWGVVYTGKHHTEMDLERLPNDVRVLSLETEHRRALQFQAHSLEKRKEEAYDEQLNKFTAVSKEDTTTSVTQAIKAAQKIECQQKIGVGGTSDNYDKLGEKAFMGLWCNSQSCDEIIKVETGDGEIEEMTREEAGASCEKDYCVDSCLQLLYNDDKMGEDAETTLDNDKMGSTTEITDLATPDPHP